MKIIKDAVHGVKLPINESTKYHSLMIMRNLLRETVRWPIEESIDNYKCREIYDNIWSLKKII